MGFPFELLLAAVVLLAAGGGLVYFRSSKQPEVLASKPKQANAQSEATPEREANLSQALSSTRENFLGRIFGLFKDSSRPPQLEDIEEILYTSDLGPKVVQRFMRQLESSLDGRDLSNQVLVEKILKDQMLKIFAELPDAATTEGSLRTAMSGPSVYMIVGVNGAGKTTSIGKLAVQFAQQGKKVLVAAGDTFRAAAGAQLKVWTERAQVEIFAPEGITDPSAVAFDAVAKGRAQGYDVILIDTAGRLHSQAPLMEELKKVHRVISKQDGQMPHETLIVLDANMGQNALVQAREFHQILGLSGAILTKMDGTAKGGVAIGLVEELKIPVKFIGIGERPQDLRVFSAHEFVESIFNG